MTSQYYNEIEIDPEAIDPEVRGLMSDIQDVEATRMRIERRAATLEATLINRNATTDYILEVCKRIRHRWQEVS